MRASSVLTFPAISEWVADGREMAGRIRAHDDMAATHEQLASESRRLGVAARIEFGTFLLKVRASMPKRGTATNGWKAYLEAIEVDDSTAHRYMELAAGAGKGTLTSQSEEVRRNESPPLELVVPPPTDADAPVQQLAVEEAVEQAEAAKAGADPDGDHDTWCTPEWLALALPALDLDPCSNPWSVVRAEVVYMLEAGQNGLELPWFGMVFVNPPYSKPLPWAQKLEADRARIDGCAFLMNTAGDTAWWQLLVKHLPLRLDFNKRIQFMATTGLKASSNDRPQTMLMDEAFWAKCDQDALLARGTLWRRV